MMNCFNHPNQNAIGICKVCNKGLCHECATDMDYSIACKNKHEKGTRDIKMIIDGSTKAYNAAPKNILIGPIFSLLVGLIFSVFGYFSKGGITDLPFILGIAFIVFGIVIFIRNRTLIPSKQQT